MSAIAVFGSSLPREGEPAYEEARELGREIARRGAAIVCGGYGGVMEAACRGAAELGGEAIGVVLARAGEPNRWVTRRVVAEDLAARLRHLRDDADGWVFLPRGLGTMLELVFVAESVVKGETQGRPVVLLGPFWKGTLAAILSESAGPGAATLERALRFAADPGEAARLALT
ncbi:MAG: LOG family protein [Thermoanaerobaculia bacterium]